MLGIVTRIMLPVLLLLAGAAAAQNDLLPANVAFRFTAAAVSEQTVEVRFAIAEGYYLYRERFAFATDSANVKLGPAQLPVGERKHDENFGDVEVYHDGVVARLPVQLPPGTRSFRLKVTSQGCAEAGVCYPPQSRTVELAPAQRPG